MILIGLGIWFVLAAAHMLPVAWSAEWWWLLIGFVLIGLGAEDALKQLKGKKL